MIAIFGGMTRLIFICLMFFVFFSVPFLIMTVALVVFLNKRKGDNESKNK